MSSPGTIQRLSGSGMPRSSSPTKSLSSLSLATTATNKGAADIKLRPAHRTDIPEIHEILSHYIENTVLTFRLEPPPWYELLHKLEVLQSQRLPYIVAVTTGPVTPKAANGEVGGDGERKDSATGDEMDQMDESGTEDVVGYCYVSKFRGEKLGYERTAEITIFVHPEYTRQGIGKMLMNQLLAVLKDPERYPEYVGPGHDGPLAKKNSKDGCNEKVRNLIACIAVDEDGPKKGLGLKEWYESFGFEQSGRLKGVGWKFGKSIDTIYMQLCI